MYTSYHAGTHVRNKEKIEKLAASSYTNTRHGTAFSCTAQKRHTAPGFGLLNLHVTLAAKGGQNYTVPRTRLEAKNNKWYTAYIFAAHVTEKRQHDEILRPHSTCDNACALLAYRAGTHCWLSPKSGMALL